MTITIQLKTFKEDGNREQFYINKLKKGLAKRIYCKLIYRWNHYKVVDMPLFCMAIAADEIHNISISK